MDSMAPLTVLTSPTATSANNAYLLTASAPGTPATVTKIAPKRSSDGGRPRRNRPSSPATRGPSVARRNERERNRVRQVNMGFATLRQHVPNRSKKMSKVETLRSAVQYIRQLQTLLGEDGDDSCGTDENYGGGVPAFAEAFARQQHALAQHHHHHHHSSAGGASSPAPSLGSDASSPYDSLSPEDEELMDFTTWLS